jgi:phenylacetic acid degradation operon negative regulatory protein
MIEHMFDPRQSARPNSRRGIMSRVSALDSPPGTTVVRLRPLTARSAILSLLLGSHPPSATVSELVAFGRQLAIKDSAVRAALTRMVAATDLHRDHGRYTLSNRLLERQRRQDEAMQVPTEPWNGTWLVAAVVSNGRDRASRLQLRRSMLAAHFGELREGVWMRPDNLPWRPDDAIVTDLATMHARPTTSDAELVEQLFRPADWAAAGRDLLGQAERSISPRDRLTAFATIVRHLTHDPLLPVELLPPDWPGDTLRAAYEEFRSEVVAFRRSL